MFRLLHTVALSTALFASSAGAVQDSPKQDPPKKDPKPAAQKITPATDEEADAALTTFKKAMTAELASTQMAALRDVAKVRHEKIVRAIGAYVRSNHPDVATCAALQLGEQDHPVSSDILVAGIGPNDRRPVVLGAIFTSLGKLGYESASPALVALLDKSNDDGWKKVLEEGINAIGRIGSWKAVDPLLDWRRKHGFGGGGRWGGGGGGQGSGRLWTACERALKSITGGDEETTADWEKWWKANRADLLAGATVTYRCRISWERYDGSARGKNPCPHAPDKGHTSCAQQVRMRLVPEPDAPSDGPGSAPGGGGGNP